MFIGKKQITKYSEAIKELTSLFDVLLENFNEGKNLKKSKTTRKIFKLFKTTPNQ